MNKEVDIKAVIGYSGTYFLTKDMFMTVFSFTLTTNILSTPWGQLWSSGTFFPEPKHSYGATIAKYHVLSELTQQ